MKKRTICYRIQLENGVFKSSLIYDRDDANARYDALLPQIHDPEYRLHKGQLVAYERLHYAWKITLTFKWRIRSWYWKPYFFWEDYQRHFHWLFLMSWIEPQFSEFRHHVERDDANPNFKRIPS